MNRLLAFNWAGEAQKHTLQIEEGAAVSGSVRGGLGDGQEVGAIAFKEAAHEAQESLLDLQLQLLLTPIDQIVISQQEL